MDELVHHCLRELSFDGDLGCGTSRLRDFIIEFYSQSGGAYPQTVDDAFYAFVWGLIIQDPKVIIGTVPPGSQDVYIAPQMAQQKKNKAKGEPVEQQGSALDAVENAKTRSLDELTQEYGDTLRIAVDPVSSFVAITGSHTRPPKLSGLVYTALQFITRGREHGISVVDLGKGSGYDQKTCFYLVKQLLELDLVVKVRRGGVGTHFCIHKYFFERSPLWKGIREEEAAASEAMRKDAEEAIAQAQAADADDDMDIDAEGELEEDEEKAVTFEPMDARHLSSLPLVRARVVKLLKASRNYMHQSSNMLLTIGFSNPTKTDRRFFASRIRDLVQQGVLERTLVPNMNRRDTDAVTKCFRLVTAENQGVEVDGVVVERQEEVEEAEKQKEGFELILSNTGIKANLTIHKQIHVLLELSGTRGMTLNELATTLAAFDKRTIELLLARATKNPPPAHLDDLGIEEVMETHGRERRHRYFTIASFNILCAQEKLDASVATIHPVRDASIVGGFMPCDASMFHTGLKDLAKYSDEFKDKSNASLGRGKARKNPVLADGTIKQGRPTKKRLLDAEGNEIVPNRRGKYNKKTKVDANEPVGSEEEEGATAPISMKPKKTYKRKRTVDDQGEAGAEQQEKPKATPKRARPAKKQKTEESVVEGFAESAELGVEPVKPKRGRGKKAAADGDATPVTPKPKAKRVPKKQKEALAAAEAGASAAAAALVEEPLAKESKPEAEPEIEEDAVVPPKAARSTRKSVPAPASKRKAGNASDVVMSDGEDLPAKKKGRLEGEGLEEEPPAAPEADFEMTLDQDQDMDMDAPLPPSPPADEALGLDLGLDIPMDERPEETPEPANDEVKPPMQLVSDVTGIPSPPKAKKISKTNMSHMRRENEIIRIVEHAGGICTVHNKDFFDSHAAMIRTMVAAGETTSGPVGARLDKRTAHVAIESLANKGRLKQLKTSVVNPVGASRPVNIVYLPDLTDEKLAEYLVNLSRTVQANAPTIAKTIDQRVDYSQGSIREYKSRPDLALGVQRAENEAHRKQRREENNAKLTRLWTQDDETLRGILLTEWTTLGQRYGFIVSKAVRACKLHGVAMADLESNVDFANIASVDHRVFHLNHFFRDLPLETYAVFASCLNYSEELDLFLETPDGPKTPVRDLPDSLYSLLQVGRSRARARILDIFEVLRVLGIVTPLEPTESSEPWLTIATNGEHPTKFGKASLIGWSAQTPITVPVYWQFNVSVPIHLWVLSHIAPPVWKDMPISTTAEVKVYWDELAKVSIDAQYVELSAHPRPDVPALYSDDAGAVGRCLRRAVSWNPNYSMTWHQEQYLKRFVDTTTAATPMQDEDGGAARLATIEYVSSVPHQDVVNFLEGHHSKLQAQMAKGPKRKRRVKETAAVVDKVQEGKDNLVRKAAENKHKREQAWEELVLRVHGEALEEDTSARVRHVRGRYMQSTMFKDARRWEKEVSTAILDSSSGPEALKLSPRKPGPPENAAAGPSNTNQAAILAAVASLSKSAPKPTGPPAVCNPPEKSIASLISLQGPKLAPRVPRSRKNAEPKTSAPIKRTRFLWTRDYEELARDASVVIRARCRTYHRMDWGALEQVFPAVPRNSVRQRLVNIRESPGNDAYLKRLEDRFHELWIQYRGTPALPDDHPTSPIQFDLVKHMEFLRKHVDKNALRVGLTQSKERRNIKLPSSVDEIPHQWNVNEITRANPTWDFMYWVMVEEGREKSMVRHAMTAGVEPVPLLGYDPPADLVAVAEASIKMVLGTPNDTYLPEAASTLLHDVGQASVASAMAGLLDRGVLSKLVRDPSKSKPGRSLKISDLNQNQAGGPIPGDTFQDAIALDEVADEQGNTWREWPVMPNDGDLAALMEMVSEDKVDFKVDISHSKAMRAVIDWNSKKADDNQIETSIEFSFKTSASTSVAQASPSLAPSPPADPEVPAEMDTEVAEQMEVVESSMQHAITIQGASASCKKESEGMVDCLACLEDVSSTFVTSLEEEDRDLAMNFLDGVHQAGEIGLSKEQVLSSLAEAPVDKIMGLIQLASETSPPLVFWAGYNSLVLVSAAYLKPWSVTTSESPCTKVLPRRWLDIAGMQTLELWELATRAVMGVILFRPGISQAELRWRLRAAYDRQEINELLYWLHDGKFLTIRTEVPAFRPSIPLDDEEEAQTFLFISEERHWYNV